MVVDQTHDERRARARARAARPSRARAAQHQVGAVPTVPPVNGAVPSEPGEQDREAPLLPPEDGAAPPQSPEDRAAPPAHPKLTLADWDPNGPYSKVSFIYHMMKENRRRGYAPDVDEDKFDQ